MTAGLLSRAGDGEAFRELTGPRGCVRLIAGLGGGTVKGYPEGAGSVPAAWLVAADGLQRGHGRGASPSKPSIRVAWWILRSGEYDAVADFAAAVADPQQLNPSYDSGDHLHPNDAATGPSQRPSTSTTCDPAPPDIAHVLVPLAAARVALPTNGATIVSLRDTTPGQS